MSERIRQEYQNKREKEIRKRINGSPWNAAHLARMQSAGQEYRERHPLPPTITQAGHGLMGKAFRDAIEDRRRVTHSGRAKVIRTPGMSIILSTSLDTEADE